MAHSNTAFHQVLHPVSRHEFERLASTHHVGQKLRKASRWDQFVGLLMSQLSSRQSLRDIEANLESQRHKLYHLGAKPVAKSTLARLNEKQPYTLYEALFHTLLSRVPGRASGHKFRFKNPLYSLDSSLIDLSLKIFPWADYNRGKAAMKLHVGLNHDGMMPEFVAVTHGKESDLSQGRRFPFKPGSVVVFDKGYTDYSWYKSLTDKGVFFVSRMRPNMRYEVLERREVSSGGAVQRDEVIQITGLRAKRARLSVLRRVVYIDPETQREYVFISNHMRLSAQTIASIYKDRWQVELFFKAIKQNLKIRSFVGTSRNAILTQIWVAMCAYLLIAIARFSTRTGWSMQRILRVLQISLFERRCLKALLKPPKSTEPIGSVQGRLAL